MSILSNKIPQKAAQGPHNTWSHDNFYFRLSSRGLPSMRRLQKLNQLTLGNNELEKIPRLSKSVERINLRDNNFSGVLPRRSMSRLRNLRELTLASNKITAVEPDALSRTKIEYLDLGENLLEAIPEGLPSKFCTIFVI